MIHTHTLCAITIFKLHVPGKYKEIATLSIPNHLSPLPLGAITGLYSTVYSPPVSTVCVCVWLKGGSWVSTGDEASRFARFSFRRHFFQHLGFRVARSTSPAPPPVRLCTTEVFGIGTGVTSKHLCAVCMYCSLCKCVWVRVAYL